MNHSKIYPFQNLSQYHRNIHKKYIQIEKEQQPQQIIFGVLLDNFCCKEIT